MLNPVVRLLVSSHVELFVDTAQSRLLKVATLKCWLGWIF